MVAFGTGVHFVNQARNPLWVALGGLPSPPGPLLLWSGVRVGHGAPAGRGPHGRLCSGVLLLLAHPQQFLQVVYDPYMPGLFEGRGVVGKGVCSQTAYCSMLYSTPCCEH